jgi:elongation factor P
MASIGFGDLRRGVTIEINDQPYEVIDYTRHKMQQRAPVIRIRVRNLLNGSVTEKTFQAYETSFTPADVDIQESQYLYTDGQFYYFMDMETFDQILITREQIGDNINFLKEQILVEISVYNGAIIGVKMPTFVELKVTDSPPGLKGDTAQGGTKPATLETGHTLNVPLFVHEGETIKVDTRDGKYVERVS